MTVANAVSLVETESWTARARRRFIELVASQIGHDQIPVDVTPALTEIVNVEAARGMTERAPDEFECDVLAMKAEISNLDACYRQLAGARLNWLPARLLILETAFTNTTSDAQHRLVRIRQETQIRIHAIEAQLDKAKGTERLQLEVRLTHVRQQFGECTSKLSAIGGPFDESTMA